MPQVECSYFISFTLVEWNTMTTLTGFELRNTKAFNRSCISNLTRNKILDFITHSTQRTIGSTEWETLRGLMSFSIFLSLSNNNAELHIFLLLKRTYLILFKVRQVLQIYQALAKIS